MKDRVYLKPKLRTVRQRSSWLIFVMIILAALALLAAWVVLISEGRSLMRPISHGAISPALPLAMAPLPLSAVYLICGVTAVVVVICIAMAILHGRRDARAWPWEPWARKSQDGCAPADVPAVGLSDGARIAHAGAEQCGWIRLHLTEAITGNEAKLVQALAEVEQLQKTLKNLGRALARQASPEDPNSLTAQAWLEPMGGSGS